MPGRVFHLATAHPTHQGRAELVSLARRARSPRPRWQRAAALLAAVALAALAAAPSWPYAFAAAGCAGLGVAALTPLCVAAAGRLRPGAPETVLARLNVFNYVGVLVGAGASGGGLGATGHFRIAYAVPAALALLLVAAARFFRPGDLPPRSP
ncbi:MFS transporter [Streptomyces sp. NPDC047081]|uniref:MFS transporter n=1 Tax=Streptomyces sp. NPDC047081 TaxID=3154706 RepID=UPI0033C5ACB7